MKRYLQAFAMCQSMFCAIPCPWRTWDEKARPLMLLFLPLVGLEIGAIWTGIAWLVRSFDLPQPVSGLILSVYPYVITGFLHLDGFMDVTDAIRSCRELERRRAILKDPHVGAFAVIGCCLLILAQFAFSASVPETADICALLFIPAVSRCCSALAVTFLRPMSTSQYAGQTVNRSRGWFLAILLAFFLAAGFLLCGKFGLAPLAGAVGYGLALARSHRSLQGMNGDISGYALTISELCAVAAFTLI